MAENRIIVGMADLNTTKSPNYLTTLGLGSCVGVALYDPLAKVAGLLHAMLPDSKQIQNNSNTAKFVDTGIIKLIQDMEKIGAKRNFIKAKIAGGAQMFAFNSNNSALRIGERNVDATISILRSMGIQILANETGDTYGRTVEIYASDGRFVIKTIDHGVFSV